jgi:hypothetical protein
MINLSFCSPSRETKLVSDFCQLHEPLTDQLEPEVITYWKKEKEIISTKNKLGGVKTPKEKFAEVMIDYAGTNDKKYYEKKCDQINSN